MAPKGRNLLAIRLVSLHQYALRQRYMPPLDTLAREFGVCTRTIRRDLEALEAAGVLVRWASRDIDMVEEAS